MGFTVGLTGGIGSGKTTVSDGLGALGAAVIDTDVIAHAVTGAGGAAMAAIAREFGSGYVTADGALDRDRMRELVFAESRAKKRLESILHPLIREETSLQARQAAQRAPYVVLVVPLLVESGGWRERVDRTLVVDCSAATQVERVRRRSRLEHAAIAAIIRQQASRQERLAAADDIVVNESDPAALAPRVARMHEFYLGLARVWPRESL